MKRNSFKGLLAALLAAVMVFALVPAWALAEDAPIALYDGTNDTALDEAEKTFLAGCQSASAQVGGTLTLYIPIKNTSAESVTISSCELLLDNDNPPLFGSSSSAGEESGSGESGEGTGSGSTTPAATNSLSAKRYKWDTDNKQLVSDGSSELAAGAHVYFKFSQALDASVGAGKYTLKFTFTYSNSSSNDQTKTITRDVTVSAVSSGSSGGGSGYKSTPKVIIESYSFSTDRIYAGETLTLTLRIRNTSSTEAVKNMTLDFSDASGDITPAEGGSNSVFIGQIEKNDSYTAMIRLSVSPGAEAKSHLLDIALAYEGTRNRAEFTGKSSITVPVLQKIRVRITDPAIYGDPWVGQGVSMGVSLYNLGKSTIYNCAVEVVGEGLTLEEPYFGGNIAAGGTMRADLSVISDRAGQVDGQIKITFEDVYGDSYEEFVDLSMYVNDMSEMTVVTSPGDAQPSGDSGSSAGGAGFAWYWWALIAAVAIAAVIVLIVKMRNRRKKYLEEL